MEIFPKSITSLWDKWELRVWVLLSLLLQVILIHVGSRRKHRKRATFVVIGWVTYLSADWLATVSLGNLANNQGDKSKTDSKDQVLQALWAPFLLLHLGGPDTITAYALEDNSLWLRHLLGLLIQVTVAFYIFVRSLGNNALSFVAIPVFVSGVIKYSERTYALRAATPDHLEDSLHSASTLQAPDLKHINYDDDPELEHIHTGYSLFPLLERLYADLGLTFAEGQQSYSLMLKDGEKHESYAFKLVEIQLGFLFDVLYTKATIIYSGIGLFLRLISFLSIVSALVAFIVVIDRTYSRVDVVITYILFSGAILLEIYAFVSLVLSDWTMRSVTKYKNPLAFRVYKFISCCRRKIFRKKRWSGDVAQHNLVDFCLQEKAAIRTNFFRKIYFELNLLLRRKWDSADDDQKLFILIGLQEKYKEYKDSGFDGKTLKRLLSHRGDYVIEKNKFRDVIGWSLEVEFDHSILLWHVATDICYNNSAENSSISEHRASKKLSNYILYILLMRPSMLPKWIDRITHVRDTFNQAIGLFHRKKFPVKKSGDACKMLMQLHTQSQVLEVLRSEKSGKSVLLDACCLALQLQDHLKDKLWDIVCKVWVEMLTYAATQGDWGSHAQQLRSGGELLTHVALLMADLGLSEHFGTGTKGPPVGSRQNKGCGWARSKLASPDATDSLPRNRV